MPTYQYPIKFIIKNKSKYYYGVADIDEKKPVRIGYCKENKCAHESPIEASDCYRQYLLDNDYKANAGNIEDRKCCKSKCANTTTKFARLGLQEFALCDEHRNKVVIKQICGWGHVLTMTDV